MVPVAGRYESWFLSARDAEPGRPPRALWIRHTRHRAAGAAQGSAALWCTVFDPAAGAPGGGQAVAAASCPRRAAGRARLPRRGAGARADGASGT